MANRYQGSIVVVSRGAPLPPYIKDQGGKGSRPGGGASGEVLLPPGVGLPPFLDQVGEGKGRERGEEGKGGAAPLLLVLFGLEGEGRAACPGRPSSSPLWAHEAH